MTFVASVCVEETLGIERIQEPVLGGIPVAKGQIRQERAGHFVLKNAHGKGFPFQGSPAAYWPDRSVKWLHLCGQLNLQGGKRNMFTVEADENEQEPDFTAEGGDRFIRIRGGVLDVNIGADVCEILTVSDTASGNMLVKSPGLSFRMSACGPERRNTRELAFELDPGMPRLVVDGRNRKVVRLSGRMLDSGAREIMLVRLFVEVFRNVYRIGIQPVFIFTGIPEEDLIVGSELVVHGAMGCNGLHYSFGNSRGSGYSDRVRPYELGPRWPQARQLQLGSTFYKTEKRVSPRGSWVKALEGSRAQGWCHLGDADKGITAAMRYYWQEYPRSLAVDADAGTLTFGLWPVEAEPLDMRRYSPTSHGPCSYRPDIMIYESGSGPFPSREMGSAGTAKSHELALNFHAAGADDITERALSFITPCRIMADPGSLAESRVLGRLVPMDKPRPNASDKWISRAMDFYVAERDVRGWYGQIDFGDVMMRYRAETDRWAFDEGGRAWMNTELRPDYGMWLNALRAARSDWLEAAIEMTRHNRDVDMYHAGPLKGFGSRHNVSHWGCQCKDRRISMPISHRLHYFLTADPWTLEVIRETASTLDGRGTIEHELAPWGTSVVCTRHVLWELSGKEEDGKVVKKLADLMVNAFNPDGALYARLKLDPETGEGDIFTDEQLSNTTFFYAFGGQHVLLEMIQLLNHTGLSRAVLRHVEYLIGVEESSNETTIGTNPIPLLSYALEKTGNKAIGEIIDRIVAGRNFTTVSAGGEGILDEPPHRIAPDVPNSINFTGVIGTFLQMIPYHPASRSHDGKSPGKKNEYEDKSQKPDC